MPIPLVCPNGHKLQVKEEFAGKKAKCPKCGAIMNVPALATPERVAPPPTEADPSFEVVDDPGYVVVDDVSQTVVKAASAGASPKTPTHKTESSRSRDSQRPRKVPRLLLLGAAGGVAVGLVAVIAIWLLMPDRPRPGEPSPQPPQLAGDAPTPKGPPVEPPGIPGAAAAPGESSAEPAPVAAAPTPPVRKESQEEIDKKLKQIGLAFHNHYDVYRTFAPPMHEPAKPMSTRLSWRVHLLPYLDQKPLYEQFHLDEPWDSEHNKTLLDKMPDVFRIGVSEEHVTRIQVFTGPRVLFGPGKNLAMRDVTDGLPNTIMAIVVGPDRAVPWTKPDDLPLDEKNPAAALGTPPDGVFDCLMGNGLSLTLPADVVPEILVALATPAGGEVVDGGSIRRGIGVKTVSATTTASPSSGSPAAKPGAAAAADPRQPKLVKPTETPKTRETLQKLYQITLAMVQYSESNGGRLPAAGDPATFKEDERPKLSWRVHLLPYLQQRPLFDAFHLDEPWDSPHNLTLLDKMPEIYRSVGTEASVTRTQVLYGDKMLFGAGVPRQIRMVPDGYDSTIMVVLSGWDRAVPWTKPEDILFDPAAPVAGLGSIGPDPILCSTVLEKTMVIPADIDASTFAALATPAGREVVDARRFLKQWHEVSTAGLSPAPSMG